MTQPERQSSRVFPLATPALYENERVGLRVLSLTQGASTWFTRVAPFRPSPVRRLARLLSFHRAAIDAEVRQLHRRADFFWREAIRQLDMLWRDETAWPEAIADQSSQPHAAGIAMTPEVFRTAVLCELFADVHWGFYQAHVRADATPDNRGFVHLDYLLQLATRTSGLDGARTSALARALRGLVDTCLRHKRWQRAEQVASTLIERFGDGEEHQNLLATAICRRAIDEMNHGDDEAAAARDAEGMKAVAARLETLRTRFARNALLFDLLAGIHVRTAIALANSGQLAEALVAIHKALAFNPALQDADEAREKLIQLMNEFRDQAPTIEARVNAFVRSPEAAGIVAARRIAQGHAIWRSLGLPPLLASNEQIHAFYAALTSTLQRANGDGAKVESAWDAAIHYIPGAAAVDRAAVVAWVRRKMEGTAAERTADHTVDDASAWPCEVEGFVLADGPGGRDGEPVRKWVFGWPGAHGKWIRARRLPAG